MKILGRLLVAVSALGLVGVAQAKDLYTAPLKAGTEPNNVQPDYVECRIVNVGARTDTVDVQVISTGCGNTQPGAVIGDSGSVALAAAGSFGMEADAPSRSDPNVKLASVALDHAPA